MQIEKNVPMPVNAAGSKTSRGRKCKYPFADMEVGDSFEVLDGAYVVGSAAGAYGRRHNMKFTYRVVNGVARVWRVA